jgi:hypothetical protein
MGRVSGRGGYVDLVLLSFGSGVRDFGSDESEPVVSELFQLLFCLDSRGDMLFGRATSLVN